MKNMAIFALFLTTTHLWGFDLKVLGRNYTFSCSHYTSVQGDVVLSFTDNSLPWGTTVSFVTGWEGREGFPESRFEWRDREEHLATAKAPYTWQLKLSKVLHQRSHASLKDTLNFVVKIQTPGRPDTYLNGGSPWGFFKTRLIENTPGQCVTGLEGLPELSSLAVESVRRD